MSDTFELTMHLHVDVERFTVNSVDVNVAIVFGMINGSYDLWPVLI